MKIKTELFGGKYDGKPIEVDSHVKEVLIPDISIYIDDDLEFGDPTQPISMNTISYKLNKDGKYTPFRSNK